jgi:hypothetical protein
MGFNVPHIDIREYIDFSSRSLPALFWLSSYVTSHYLAVAPQSGAKQNSYCTVYYITLDPSCEARRASKNLKKIVEVRVGRQK